MCLRLFPSLIGLGPEGLDGGTGAKIASSLKYNQTNVAQFCVWKKLEAQK